MAGARIFIVILMGLTLYIRQAAGSSPAENLAQNDAANEASPYVPVNSWVYPAFSLLAAKGYVQSAFFNLRPWTRLDCARLVEEADDLTADTLVSDNIALTLRALHQEFALELRRRAGEHNTEFRIESIDQSTTVLSGTPLVDGYHFAETQVNNDGRPFGSGTNLYSGISLRATYGHIAMYLRGEIQRASVVQTPNAAVQQEIAAVDFTPHAMAAPLGGILRGRLLDANIAFAFANNQFIFGKQTLWWGPARSGATLFSNNAEPVSMFRYDRVQPFELPGILRRLGPLRIQLLLGRLEGAQYVHAAHVTVGSPGVALKNQPWIHGEKISFIPTPNFEFGVSRTVLFAGQNAPFTTSAFLRSIFSAGTGDEEHDPGDRRIAFDASYRIPGLRDCLTGYVDTFTEDEPFPVLYPRVSTWISGFVLRCVPRLPRLTIRSEGLLSPHRNEFPGYYYFNVHYLSGYTNNRQLMGSWIGREGQGEQVWATWQISPHSFIELSGRSMNSGSDFLRGGSLRDFHMVADLALRPEWQLRLEDQAERWHFPLLSSRPQKNNTFTFQLSYRPIGRTQ